jgi:hypothetical protein
MRSQDGVRQIWKKVLAAINSWVFDRGDGV